MDENKLTLSQVMMLIEDLRSQFRIVAESVTGLSQKIAHLSRVVEVNSQDISHMKLFLQVMNNKKVDKENLAALERKIKSG